MSPSGPAPRPAPPVLAHLLAAASVAVAALLLGPLFSDSAWVVPTLGAALVVGLAGCLGNALAGALPATRRLVPFLPLLVLTAYVTARLGSGLLGVVPTPATFDALVEGLLGARDAVWSQVAPVPASGPLVLLAVLGVGLLALLADALVRLRFPALVSLLLVTLLVVPSSLVLADPSPLVFAVSAALFLALLLVSSAPAGRPLPSPGRRLGLGAVALGLLVPVLVPVGPGGVAATLSRLSLGQASSSATALDPLVRLRGTLEGADDSPVLRFETDDPAPGYLRVAVLDVFDGEGWRSSELTAPLSAQASSLPAAPGLAEGVEVTPRRWSVEVEDLRSPLLPLPYPTRRVDVEGDWRYDSASLAVFSARDRTRPGAAYSVESLRVDPDPEALATAPVPRSSFRERYTELPSLSPYVVDVARDVTRSADSPYEEVVLIQDYLRGPSFTYSLVVPPGDGDPLEDFLRSKQGFCQQYAAAMAVMVRSRGIPARVVVGFTPGRQQRDGSWLVTSSNAHAWPEVYFEGTGWIPFEPTPRSTGQVEVPSYSTPVRSLPGAPSPFPSSAPRDDLLRSGSSGTAPLRPQDSAPAAAAPVPALDLPVAPVGASSAPWLLLLALLVLLALPGALSPLLRSWLLRPGRDPRERARAAWELLRLDAADVGVPLPASASARTGGALLRPHLSAPAHGPLDRVLSAFERAAYAPSCDPSDVEGVSAALGRVRSSLLASAPRSRRLRARLLPSVVPVALRSGWVSLAGRLRLPARP